MSAAELLNEAAKAKEQHPTTTSIEKVLNSRVEEAKDLIAEGEDARAAQGREWLIPTQAQLDLIHETEAKIQFLRGVVAGINYSIRRVREQAATNG